MITLEIAFHYGTHRFFFETLEAAQAVLDALEKEIKVDMYNRIKESGRTFRFNDACGPSIVVIDRIDNARIIDYDIHTKVVKDHEDKQFAYRLERETQARQILKDKGLLLSNDNKPVIIDSDVGL